MGLKLEYIEGQTPLDEDEKDGLLIETISTRAELDEFEQANIQKAIEWSMKNSFIRDELVTLPFILKVHKKMFDEVWDWAGEKRKTNKKLGVDKNQIAVEIEKLINDCNYWIDENTFEPDEIAIRFSHRLVQIHVFPNGNGRHSRFMADIFISNIFNKPVFSWGSSDLAKGGEIRQKYLSAIYDADDGKFEPLIEFARS